jgi:hypothetical protein
VPTLVKSQLQAYLIAALYFLCLMLLTGFIYPLEKAVDSIQILSHILPLTYSQEYFTSWLLQGAQAEHYQQEIMWLVLQSIIYSIFAWSGLYWAKKTI